MQTPPSPPIPLIPNNMITTNDQLQILPPQLLATHRTLEDTKHPGPYHILDPSQEAHEQKLFHSSHECMSQHQPDAVLPLDLGKDTQNTSVPSNLQINNNTNSPLAKSTLTPEEHAEDRIVNQHKIYSSFTAQGSQRTQWSDTVDDLNKQQPCTAIPLVAPSTQGAASMNQIVRPNPLPSTAQIP